MNIHDAATTLQLQTNAGTNKTNWQGYHGNNLLWLDPAGIANVISLCSLEEHFCIIYDITCNGGSFICHTTTGPVKFLHCTQTGFHYINLTEAKICDAITLIQTIQKITKALPGVKWNVPSLHTVLKPMGDILAKPSSRLRWVIRALAPCTMFVWSTMLTLLMHMQSLALLCLAVKGNR